MDLPSSRFPVRQDDPKPVSNAAVSSAFRGLPQVPTSDSLRSASSHIRAGSFGDAPHPSRAPARGEKNLPSIRDILSGHFDARGSTRDEGSDKREAPTRLSPRQERLHTELKPEPTSSSDSSRKRRRDSNEEDPIHPREFSRLNRSPRYRPHSSTPTTSLSSPTSARRMSDHATDTWKSSRGTPYMPHRPPPLSTRDIPPVRATQYEGAPRGFPQPRSPIDVRSTAPAIPPMALDRERPAQQHPRGTWPEHAFDNSRLATHGFSRAPPPPPAAYESSLPTPSSSTTGSTPSYSSPVGGAPYGYSALPPQQARPVSYPGPAVYGAVDRSPFANAHYAVVATANMNPQLHGHVPGHGHPGLGGHLPAHAHTSESAYLHDLALASEGGRPRKRRGNLPKDTTDKLRSWFHGHLQHPYPTEDQKQELMRQTGLQMNQISNWFINARRRQLPAMINSARAEEDARSAQGPRRESDSEEDEEYEQDDSLRRQSTGATLSGTNLGVATTVEGSRSV